MGSVVRTPTQRLADALLPDGLDLFVVARRAEEYSWRRIASDLARETDWQVDVTAESLRTWYATDVEDVA